MSEEKKIEVKEEDVAVEARTLFQRIKLGFNTGVFVLSGIVGALFASKKIFSENKQENEQSQNRGPASVSDDYSPWRLNIRLAQLAEEVKERQTADDQTHREIKETVAQNRRDQREDNADREAHSVRLEAMIVKINDKVDRMLDILERQPKAYSGLDLLNPNKKAN